MTTPRINFSMISPGTEERLLSPGPCFLNIGHLPVAWDLSSLPQHSSGTVHVNGHVNQVGEENIKLGVFNADLHFTPSSVWLPVCHLSPQQWPARCSFHESGRAMAPCLEGRMEEQPECRESRQLPHCQHQERALIGALSY